MPRQRKKEEGERQTGESDEIEVMTGSICSQFK